MVTDITNKLNGCNGDVVNKLISKDLTGKIRDIIQDIFNSSDNINLNFVESSDTKGVAASSNIIQNGSVVNIEVRINTSILPWGASQDYKGSIILHEILHGYFNYKGIDFKNQLKQHSDIAHNYINDIASILQQAFKTDAENAKALAFGGLKDFAIAYPGEYDQLLQDNGLTESKRNSDAEFQRAGLNGMPCK
ncbi:hypothetical protein LX99_03791 [Mucilaginibacter oryzae]|uniref:SprT-like family protein n=1 Tax=Mucilaginibacter oryzae TaxID=468058 RepID=A0A316H4L7_9SPHI|nr:hypothetical protein [Mucilaginibacter oryzae]PWK75298.1 hypothetical protein LX99_03791 [Mucilaginibacter oryzae]